jgi:hypothetical protein
MCTTHQNDKVLHFLVKDAIEHGEVLQESKDRLRSTFVTKSWSYCNIARAMAYKGIQQRIDSPII